MSVLRNQPRQFSSNPDINDTMYLFLKVTGDVRGSGGGHEVASGEWNHNQEVSAPHSPNTVQL